jgi:hypothetical protein
MTRSEGRAQTGIATSILKSVSGMVEGWLLYPWVCRNLTVELLCSTEDGEQEGNRNKYDKWHGMAL